MKTSKKIRIFALITVLFIMLFTVSAFATDETVVNTTVEQTTEAASNKLDMNEQPGAFSSRSVELALQGTATGMIMVFAVLALLAVIVTLSKVVLYDIPNKKQQKAEEKKREANKEQTAEVVETPVPVVENATDDGELVAVITAAIAAMIESGDYKNEFVGGFRVVSFKRSTNSAWNRK